MIRDLYEPPAPAPAREVMAARARLDGVARQDRRRPRRRWVVPGAGLAIVAVTAAVAVVVTMPPEPPSRTSPTPQAATARTVLLNAALRADRQPATTGRYWHVDASTRWFQKVKTGGYLIRNTSREESWQAADRSGKAIDRQQDLGAQPATPADREAWRKAGSPRVFRTSRGKRTRAPERVVVWRGSAAEILDGMGAASQAGLDRLRQLPADPGKLRTWLLALPDSPTQRKPNVGKLPSAFPSAMPRPWAPPPGTRAALEEWLFVQGSSLILYSPVTPKVRAAAFRMLATLPDVKPAGTVRDAYGREGTAVAMDEIDPLGQPIHVQQRLVIAPASGRALASEEVVLGPNANFPELPTGSVGSTTTVRTADWTDTAPS
ncbi:CU044_5270 family protein [Actinoallomurus bryophytorum]|nr:CU044_5270 family protein [Actinoallomurus bryophytorum]